MCDSIAIFLLLWWSGIKPAVSLRYACACSAKVEKHICGYYSVSPYTKPNRLLLELSAWCSLLGLGLCWNQTRGMPEGEKSGKLTTSSVVLHVFFPGPPASIYFSEFSNTCPGILFKFYSIFSGREQSGMSYLVHLVQNCNRSCLLPIFLLGFISYLFFIEFQFIIYCRFLIPSLFIALQMSPTISSVFGVLSWTENLNFN